MKKSPWKTSNACNFVSCTMLHIVLSSKPFLAIPLACKGWYKCLGLHLCYFQTNWDGDLKFWSATGWTNFFLGHFKMFGLCAYLNTTTRRLPFENQKFQSVPLHLIFWGIRKLVSFNLRLLPKFRICISICLYKIYSRNAGLRNHPVK